MRIFAKDGRRVPLLATAVLLPGPQALAMAVDLSPIRRVEAQKDALEDQLRQSQKLEAIGSLAGGIAHDFNNLLSVILTYAELIQGDLDLRSPIQRDLGEIESAARRAAKLTGQLLAFGRRQVLRPRVLELPAVVANLRGMLRRLLPEDIELALRMDPATGPISADPGQLEQVVVNLVVNARDAITGSGTVTLAIDPVVLDETFALAHVGAGLGLHARLSVSDTGDGIDDAIRARIFEPFFTTKPLGEGTGLGLSTVHGIVQQSGGSVFVDSELGRGTRFDVYLPIVDRCVETVPAPSVVGAGGTETILLCEDEDQVRAALRRILTRVGYRVIEATNGAEALAVTGAIDLLLTDLVMPGISGRELAERLVARRPGLAVIYMSGYTDDAIVRYGVARNAVAFLQKPIEPAELTRKLREILDAPRV